MNRYINDNGTVIVHVGWSDVELDRKFGSGNWVDVGQPDATLKHPFYNGEKWIEKDTRTAQEVYAERWMAYRVNKDRIGEMLAYIQIRMMETPPIPSPITTKQVNDLGVVMTKQWAWLKANETVDFDRFTGVR